MFSNHLCLPTHGAAEASVEMPLSVQHVDACVPITALKTFDWNQRNLVFQGQGPFFRVINDRTGDVSAQVRVFRRNNVHGFIILPQTPHQNDSGHVQVLVWGGQSLRAVDLSLGPDDSIAASPFTAEFLAPDWIMNGCAAMQDQLTSAYLITANNALLSVQLVPSTLPRHRYGIHIYQLTTSVKSILYAADLIALSDSHVLVAAGTAFGEIIVWSCFIDFREPSKLNAFGSIHHFFTGHDGSIFGVRISSQIPSLNVGQSGRLLASCSDDRTVQIWDISDCEHKSSRDPSAYSTDGFELRSTGFGSFADGYASLGSEACVAKAFGHRSRIWSVNFRALKPNDPCTMGLVSRGEDGSCVLWDLTWTSSSPGTAVYRLYETSSLLRHYGTHLWSLDLRARGIETVLYTGGADGALTSFAIDENEPPPSQRKAIKIATPSKVGIKAFTFVTPGHFLACSTLNELQIGYLSPGTGEDVTWETVHDIGDIRSSVLMAGFPTKGLALVSSAEGRIRLYNHKTKSLSDLMETSSRSLAIFPLESASPAADVPESVSFLISYTTDHQATFVSVTDWQTEYPRAESFTFNLPAAPFTVSSAALISKDQYLFIGSKLGGMTVYRVPGLGLSSEPLMVNRRVHGREGTNTIQALPSSASASSAETEYVLSCGRDGTYCLQEFKISGDEGTSVSLEPIHQTPSALGGNLAGCYFDSTSGDLIVYGFRSQNFVLRNETTHMDLVSIPSGGARRLWDFHPGVSGQNEALFLWREGFTLCTRRICIGSNRSLRNGVHGREIKSMHSFEPVHGNPAIFAAGAEDTTVRIFASSSPASAGPWGSFECLRSLDAHNSGLQQITWSNDGRYLFTCAACEEFFVWRVRLIPSFGIAASIVASGPKEDPTSELRIMSFDFVEVAESPTERGFLLAMVLANSTIKIFHFSPSNDNKFTLLAKGTYMTNCLTQAHFLVEGSSVRLITAATDGYFTIWDLTSTLAPFYEIHSSKLEIKPSIRSSSIIPATINCENRYQIHSNTIKTMELVPLSDTDTVVLTGGDDNSVSASLLKTSSTDSSTGTHVATVSVPDAHTASVTTLKVLNRQFVQASGSQTKVQKLIVASSGNDHRVKIWSIEVDPSQPVTRGISIELLLDRYSSVADISSIGLLTEPGTSCQQDPVSLNGAKLLVCGVGMEMLALAWD